MKNSEAMMLAQTIGTMGTATVEVLRRLIHTFAKQGSVDMVRLLDDFEALSPPGEKLTADREEIISSLCLRLAKCLREDIKDMADGHET